jgi:hypothetical protein
VGERDPWSVTIDQSRLPIPPLDLKSNNQITWAGGDDAMDEGEASEGGEGRGGEGARAMDRHDDALTHRSCWPTPPLNLQVNNEVNNQLRGQAGRTRCPTVRPASAVREGGWEEEGARAMEREDAAPSHQLRRPVAPSPHPPLDLRNQLVMATREETQWVMVRQGRGGEGGDVQGKE